MKSIYYFKLLICVALSVPTLCVGALEPSVPGYIASAQQDALKDCLSAHPEFRVATDKDCECADHISSIRKGYGGVWKANPNYHPYFASGDFNGDNENDFAVILIKHGEKRKHYLAIFNGPYTIGTKPAYLSVAEGALFYGAPRPKPYRLIIGNFESEGASLEPKGASYELVGSDCC